MAGSAGRSGWQARLRRWSRRLALALLALAVAVTLAAIAFDLATDGTEQPAAALYPGPFVSADGTLLAYRHWGDRGSPIVLLGGAAEPSWVWHEVGPLLARSAHRVFALDLPPWGYSQRHGPYTMTHWLRLLGGFERRLHIVRPLLVGHSLGAGVAAAAALARPRDVRGVALLDGDALSFGGGTGWLADLLVYPYYTALYRIVTGSDWIVGRVFRNAVGTEPAPPRPRHALPVRASVPRQRNRRRAPAAPGRRHPRPQPRPARAGARPACRDLGRGRHRRLARERPRHRSRPPHAPPDDRRGRPPLHAGPTACDGEPDPPLRRASPVRITVGGR